MNDQMKQRIKNNLFICDQESPTEPLKNYENIWGEIEDLSGDAGNIFGNAFDLQGDVSGLSGNIFHLSGNVTGICGNVTGIMASADEIREILREKD